MADLHPPSLRLAVAPLVPEPLHSLPAGVRLDEEEPMTIKNRARRYLNRALARFDLHLARRYTIFLNYVFQK